MRVEHFEPEISAFLRCQSGVTVTEALTTTRGNTAVGLLVGPVNSPNRLDHAQVPGRES